MIGRDMLMIVLFVASLLPQAAAPPAPAPPASYVPERVFDTRRNLFSDFEAMLAELASADVVLVGEQHDDPNTHRLELALLEGWRRRRVAVTVSLEMFERDVQEHVDRYLAGAIEEPAFLERARPWPRYATDYRPLVELARAEKWRVIAANVPRRLASDIAKGGREAIERFSEPDRALAAGDIQCPKDDYFDRFASTMSRGHANTTPSAADAGRSEERYYWAQCLKDETMAESIVASVQSRGQGGPVVHFTGAFHTDFGQGTAERVKRRLPGRKVAVLSIRPVADLDALTPAGEDLRRADYLVYTAK
jgi:uncharacterized iron-regulated protein